MLGINELSLSFVAAIVIWMSFIFNLFGETIV